jgi:putative acetyltransferase
MSAIVTDVALRPESADDAIAIKALLEEAFGGGAEAALVERLRATGEMVLALVAIASPDVVVGFIAFERLQIEMADGSRTGIALAPLAVGKAHQRCGIGSALVREGIARLAACHEEIVFVLGDSAFYERFGFSVAAASAFTSRYQGPHFMAIPLAATAPGGGKVHYPAAFDDLG